LVERGARRLVLAGRTALPDRRRWHMLDASSSIGRQVAAVRELESLGASIHAVALDVTDEKRMREFVENFRREGWPSIRGVIHAAGVVQPRRFADLDASQLRDTLAPKLAGGWNLHKLLAEEPLDFFVLCSSLNALGFSMGVADYAASNAFLDGLAHSRRNEGLHALSVNWSAWDEVGMASEEQVAHDFERRGIIPIRPVQGVEALERSLEHDLRQVVVLAADWQRILRTGYPTAEAPAMVRPIAEQLAASGPASEGAGQQEDVRAKLAEATDDKGRRQVLEDFLADVVARTLTMTFSNDGTKPMTLQFTPNAGEKPVDSVTLAPGEKRTVEFPKGWSGNFRDTAGDGTAATLGEVKFDGGHGQTYYDVSYIEGHNASMTIQPRSGGRTSGTLENLVASAPDSIKAKDANGAAYGIKKTTTANVQDPQVVDYFRKKVGADQGYVIPTDDASTLGTRDTHLDVRLKNVD
ncbi:SDR family NAD(P)-dependent oxidoreductase, partial [Pyxidicoccus sp. 3LG]